MIHTPTPSGAAPPPGTPPSRRVRKVAGEDVSLHNLSPRIDSAWDALYDQAMGAGIIQWPDFQGAVQDFVRGGVSPEAMNYFFESATPLWKLLTTAERYDTAAGIWSSVLDSVVTAEGVVGFPVHKGAGYYFWACNAFRRGDDEQGLLLMHEALVEDARTQKVAPPAWPVGSAAKVVSLDAELLSTHPASWWVGYQVNGIKTALDEQKSKLGMADLRAKLFLGTEPANAFLFVHAHSSLLRLGRMPRGHRDNDFVARLALSHLFHLAVIAERLIAAKSARKGEFGAQIQELSERIGGNLRKPIPSGRGEQYASDINAQQSQDADALLRGLLGGTATYGKMTVPDVDRALCIGYALRNQGGHQAAAPRVVADEVDSFRTQMVGLVATCIAAYY
jgi:hypothetical protein